MRDKGKLTKWDDGKGFGFITPNSGGKEIFIHVSSFANRNMRPLIDQIVTYTVSTDKHGRPCAIEATVTGDHLLKKKKRSQSSTVKFIAPGFLIIVGIVVFAGRMPYQILFLYLGVSFVTFVFYARDKSAAKDGAWRTPESTLHFLSLIGGWPGALIAQQKLRHKSKKQSFRIVFWMTALINIAVFVWLFSPDGTTMLSSLIG